MIRLFLSSILALVVLIGCSQNRKSQYRSFLDEHIPEKLQPQLPKEINESIFELHFNLFPENDGIIGDLTTIYVSYTTSNLDSLLNYLRPLSQSQFKFHDSCNLVLYRFQKGKTKLGIQGKEHLYNKWLMELENCDHINGPIPNFIDVGGKEYGGDYGISDDFDLYPTESKTGMHFPEKYYASEILMPKGWERGYSKGYAINPKTRHVIFWFVIW